MMMTLENFYKNKKVLITGNTGFKGSWMTIVLDLLGANVIGVALEPQTSPDMYSIVDIDKLCKTYHTDVRELNKLVSIVKDEKPDVVIHMAAQPLVLTAYREPVYTYDVNVMGTVNVCEALRQSDSALSFINVTTDKVYKNNEWVYPYREEDMLDGYDPYSNSKSCSEIVTASYIRSYFYEKGLPTSTCRAGNVIGGGDFSENRIIPDCVRATVAGKKIEVRNPNSVRPYQHVLEAVCFYIELAMKQSEDYELAGSYNVGPEYDDCLTTKELCDLFCDNWKGASWETTNYDGPHEAGFLRLDTSKAKTVLGWRPKWNAVEAVTKTVDWYKAYYNNEDMLEYTRAQIKDYLYR